MKNLTLVAVAVGFFFFSASSFAQVIRLPKERLSFELVETSTGEVTSCEHNLLSHVPWWRVSCGEREYTVDTWVQIRSKGDLFEKTLMYHVKESVSSSGTKLTQFKSHFTSFMSRGASDLIGITSQIDVRNGLADLILRIQ